MGRLDGVMRCVLSARWMKRYALSRLVASTMPGESVQVTMSKCVARRAWESFGRIKTGRTSNFGPDPQGEGKTLNFDETACQSPKHRLIFETFDVSILRQCLVFRTVGVGRKVSRTVSPYLRPLRAAPLKKSNTLPHTASSNRPQTRSPRNRLHVFCSFNQLMQFDAVNTSVRRFHHWPLSPAAQSHTVPVSCASPVCSPRRLCCHCSSAAPQYRTRPDLPRRTRSQHLPHLRVQAAFP
jgi:hypothetical protein